MVGIFCFLLKIHPRRQCIRRLLLLFLGGDNRRAVALLDTVAAESGMTAAANDRFGSVLRKIYAVGFVLFAVQYAVLAAVGGIDPQAAVGQVGGIFHLAARIEDQPGSGGFRHKDPVAVLLGDAHHIIRYQRILGGGVCVVVVADVNAERNADGQQNSQQAEEHSAGKRFFLLALHRTPLFYKHFPQSLHPLQISLLPQVSQFARKWGVYKSSCGMG